MYGDNAGSEGGARMANKLVWSFALSKEWLSEDTNGMLLGCASSEA